WYRYLGDGTLDENDVSYFNDDGFINDPTASGSGLQAGDSRLWRQLDSRIWRASRLRLSRTAPTKIRRPRIQISHRQHGYQRRHHQRRPRAIAVGTQCHDVCCRAGAGSERWTSWNADGPDASQSG